MLLVVKRRDVHGEAAKVALTKQTTRHRRIQNMFVNRGHMPTPSAFPLITCVSSFPWRQHSRHINGCVFNEDLINALWISERLIERSIQDVAFAMPRERPSRRKPHATQDALLTSMANDQTSSILAIRLD
jgi:hypothetical protein